MCLTARCRRAAVSISRVAMVRAPSRGKSVGTGVLCFPLRPGDDEEDCVGDTGHPEEDRQNQVDPEVPAEARHQEHGQWEKKDRQDDKEDGPHHLPPFAIGSRFSARRPNGCGHLRRTVSVAFSISKPPSRRPCQAERERNPTIARTMPAVSSTPPTIGFNKTVCGREMSILKNPTSATRSVMKYVKLGTTRATMPTTARINPITKSVFMTYL